MSWRDQLRPASFRGVAFYVEGAERVGGRRGQQHEYPRRDRPYFEDLGRRARSYTIEAYLLGDDVFDQRDRLVAALEEAGGGRLVHPYIGTLEVAASEYRESFTKQRGRFVRISITFVDAGENRVPVAGADTAERVSNAADAANAAAEAAFAEEFSVADQPQFVQDDAIVKIEELTDTISGLGGVSPLGTLQDVAGFARRAQRLALLGTDLTQDPAALAGELGGLIGDVSNVVGDAGLAGQVLRGISSAAAAASEIATALTPARSALLTNRRLLGDLVRRFGLIEETRAVSNLPFGADATALAQAGRGGSAAPAISWTDPDALPSGVSTLGGTSFVATADDAAALREDLGKRLDDELDVLSGANGAEPDDTQFKAVEDLRVQMIRDVDARATGLARVLTVETSRSAPALALAHRQYGDDPAKVLAGETVIVARNRVSHPGFLPGGERLEVLSVVEGSDG